MKYRKLRIAWSVAWGVMAVLLCVLWVRSYQIDDNVDWPISSSTGFRLKSIGGKIVWWNFDKTHNMVVMQSVWSDDLQLPSWHRVSMDTDSLVAFVIPTWFLIFISAVVAALPWLPHRFCLRTLLIATTLVAVGLGVVVWMT